MVAVKKITSHQLHRASSLKKGEGVKDVINSVKNFANKIHSKIIKRQGAKDLKEIAQKAKRSENESQRKYEYNKSVLEKPELYRPLFAHQNELRYKIRNNKMSYKDIKNHKLHTSMPVLKALERERYNRLFDKDKPTVIRPLDVDTHRKSVLMQNIKFKKNRAENIDRALKNKVE